MMKTNDNENSADIQPSRLQQIKQGLSLASSGPQCMELAVVVALKTDFFLSCQQVFLEPRQKQS